MDNFVLFCFGSTGELTQGCSTTELHAQALFYLETGSYSLRCPGWSWNCDPPASATQVAELEALPMHLAGQWFSSISKKMKIIHFLPAHSTLLEHWPFLLIEKETLTRTHNWALLRRVHWIVLDILQNVKSMIPFLANKNTTKIIIYGAEG